MNILNNINKRLHKQFDKKQQQCEKLIIENIQLKGDLEKLLTQVFEVDLYKQRSEDGFIWRDQQCWHFEATLESARHYAEVFNLQTPEDSSLSRMKINMTLRKK